MKQTISTAALRENLSDTVNRAAFVEERVGVTRRGMRLAGIAPYEDSQLPEEREGQEDIGGAMKALKEAARTETISLSRLEKELARVVDAVAYQIEFAPIEER